MLQLARRPPEFAVVVAFISTLLLGLWLRARWAGWPLPAWDDLLLRHAHMHLGWYGLLVPLVWALATRERRATPGPRWALAYGAAVLASTVGFLAEGYGPAAIAGSTIVLAVWLRLAWAFGPDIRRRAWGSVVAPGLLLAALCIPPIAVFTRRDPALAIALVRTFLGLMTWTVLVPVLLEARAWPAPRPLAWGLAAVATALWFGGAWHPTLAAGPAVLGLLVAVRAAVERQQKTLERVLWLGTGLCLTGFGLTATPLNHLTGVAAVHGLILGPVAASALAAFSFHRPRWAVHGLPISGLAMAGALVAPHFGILAHMQAAATLAGLGVLISAVALLWGRAKGAGMGRGSAD